MTVHPVTSKTRPTAIISTNTFGNLNVIEKGLTRYFPNTQRVCLSKFFDPRTKKPSRKKLFTHVVWLSCRNHFSLSQKNPLVKFDSIPVVFFGFSIPQIECFHCFSKLFQIRRLIMSNNRFQRLVNSRNSPRINSPR